MSDRAASRVPQRAPNRPAPSGTGLRLVPTHRARSRSRQLLFGLGLVVMFAAFLASAVFHSVLVSGQQRLDHMDQRLEQRQQEVSRTQLRVAELKSPARLVAAAQRRGMIVPAHTTWLSAKTKPTVAPGSVAGRSPSAPTGPELATGGGGAPPAGQQSSPGPGR